MEQGFTLVEIIAVLLIIAILSAFVVPKFFSMSEQAELKTLQIALNDMQSRAENAYARSIMARDGTPLISDYDTFPEIGLANINEIRATYKNFAAGDEGWHFPDDTHIEYTLKNGNKDTWEFVLVATTTSSPAKIILQKK